MSTGPRVQQLMRLLGFDRGSIARSTSSSWKSFDPTTPKHGASESGIPTIEDALNIRNVDPWRVSTSRHTALGSPGSASCHPHNPFSSTPFSHRHGRQQEVALTARYGTVRVGQSQTSSTTSGTSVTTISRSSVPASIRAQPKMNPRLPCPLNLVNGPAASPTFIVTTPVVPSG